MNGDCGVHLPVRPLDFLTRRRRRAGNRLAHHAPMYFQFLRDSGDGSDPELVLSADLLEQFQL